MALTQRRAENEGLGKRKRSSRIVDEEDELDMESYFANYVPLSNLPTPPPAAKSTPEALVRAPTSSQPQEDNVGVRPEDDLLKPSTFLASLIPQNSSIQRPSPHIIQSYLTLSALPEPTIALAACILDSLSGFFIRTWSREINALSASTTAAAVSSPATPTSPLKSYFAPTSAAQKPELVVLAALKIARDFLHDGAGCAARWWAGEVARGRFGASEVERSVWCVLRDLDFDLLSFGPEVVEGMRREIFCGGAGGEGEGRVGAKEGGQRGREDAVLETELDVLVAESFCHRYDCANGDAEKGRLLPPLEERIPLPMAMPRSRLTPIDTKKDRITVVVEGLPTPDLSPPRLASDLGDLSLGETWLELTCCC